MKMSRRLAAAGSVAALAALAAPAASQAAEQFAGVTAENRLVFFRSDSPGNFQFQVPINGLAAGERIVGIDVRPANDRIYALGSSSRLYVLNGTTGAATAVGDPFASTLNGSSFAFDFNPSVDRIRVTSDTDQNLRLNPDTGATAATDPNLAYAAGDPGAGSNPTVGAAMYTPAAFGAPTTLFDIDSARDVLVTQDPANNGTLNTRGALGVDVQEPTSGDVASDGTAYAALRRQGQANPELFNVNLATGAATPVRAQTGLSTIPGRGSDAVTSIAALGRVQDDRSAPGVSVSFSSTQLESRLLSQGALFTVNCNEACTVASSVTVGGQAAGSKTSLIAESAGLTRVDIDLNDAAKARIRRSGNTTVRLTVNVLDAAGNAVATTRVARTQTLQQRRGR